MHKRLQQKWIDILIRMPESGMGYQRVDIIFTDGSIAKDCLVFNAEEVQLPDSCAEKSISDIRIHDNNYLTRES